MPSKKATGRASGAGPGSKEDDEHDKRVSRGSSVKVQMPKLDANNYDDWMKCFETQAYASGEEAMEMLEQSKASEEDDPDLDNPTDIRRIMWKLIMDALSPAMRARYKEVELGGVEKLLRALRASHALVSSSARWGWFERLQSLELGDLGIEDYFALAENIFEKLRLQGDTLDESRKVFCSAERAPLRLRASQVEPRNTSSTRGAQLQQCKGVHQDVGLDPRRSPRPYRPTVQRGRRIRQTERKRRPTSIFRQQQERLQQQEQEAAAVQILQHRQLQGRRLVQV